MGFKKITIVILPDGIRNVRQYKIPKILLQFLFLFVLTTSAFLSWSFVDYFKMKKEAPDKALLLKENKQKEAQLVALANKIDQITSKVVELKEFENKLKVIANLEPGEDNTQFLAIGGSDPTLMDQEYSIEKAHKKLVRLMHQSLDNLENEIAVQALAKTELFEFLESQKSMFACTPSIWPTKGWSSSEFGYRKSPFTDKKEFHNGLDISARTGSPIIAPADGVVTSIQNKSYGLGILLTITHGYGLKTRYGHLSKVLVKKGQAVKRGEKIALMGNTGRSTGPHLHYEVHLKGVPVNPRRYILN